MNVPDKPLPPNLLLPAISLVAHSAEHRRPQGIMSDPVAASWMDGLSSVYYGIPNPEWELINGIITRSIIIDYAVMAFINSHRRVVVSDLGAGFSTRFWRLRPCIQMWIHIDLPDILQARCAMQRMGELEIALGRDLTNPDDYPLSLSGEFTTNTLFLAEGVLNHLPQEKAHDLLQLLSRDYRGSTLLATVMTQHAMDGLTTLSDGLKRPLPVWAIQSISELDEWLKPAHRERTWLLGKVSNRLGLVRPKWGDDASGYVFQAKL